MLREIKFRAWDKKRKRIYEVSSLHIAEPTNGGIWATVIGKDVIEDKDIKLQIQPKDIEISQYTGLKDKNGKEIYEGDILKTRNVKTGTGKDLFVECKFHDNSSGLGGAFRFNGWLFQELPDYEEFPMCEIVGNIYENEKNSN